MRAEAIISFKRYIHKEHKFNCLYEHYFNAYGIALRERYVWLTYSLVRFLTANYINKGPVRSLDPSLKNIGKQVGKSSLRDKL